MTKCVFVDFESRSQCDIWACGAYRYAEHPTTEILCLAWAIDNGPVQGALAGMDLMDAVTDLNKLVQEGAEFHAHNAYFERCMWKHQLVPKYNALPIPIRQWRCTAAKVSAHALPRQLEKAALALGVEHKKDMEGSKVMRAVCNSTGPIDQNKLDRLLVYCKRDVEAERDIDRKLPDLSSTEQRVWFMDQYINDTGVAIDVDAVQKAATLIKSETEVLNKELHTLSGGQISAGTQREAIKKYLEGKGVVLPDLTKATVKTAIAKASGDNLRVLQLRQQLSLTSNAKYSALLSAVSPDGRIRDLLIYHGASTGRWSGKLVQIQNLVKASIKPNEIDTAVALLKAQPDAFSLFYDTLPTLSSCIRGMFVPSLHHTMYVTDFSAIEARVVMWLAGDPGTKMFAEQDADPETPDIYVRMAKMIGGYATRQLGKQTVLGCGFGMGVDKFIATCSKYEIAVTPALAERAVGMYRKTFAKVPRFWYELEDAAKKCVLSNKPSRFWKLDGEFLRMILPSGRTLAYHHPKVNAAGELTYMATNSVTHKYETEHTWGGKLVENMTQAVARDIMVEAMFGVIKAGYRILFTIHDELVLEHKTGSIEEVLAIVRKVPSWAVGCPINAECDTTERYRK